MRGSGRLHGRRMARRLLVAEIDRQRAADDRLDAGARELVGEFERPEHVVGVGERERGLAVGFGQLRQLADRQRAFQQRIGRMHVQVHEAGVGHVCSSRISRARSWGRVAPKFTPPALPHPHSPGSRSTREIKGFESATEGLTSPR